VKDYRGIKEYSVFGWTKVYENNTIAIRPWTFFFRLTINPESILNDVTKTGDRTLCVWFHQSMKFVWIGYDYNFPETNDINLHDKTYGS
jgi:hypothetical protein